MMGAVEAAVHATAPIPATRLVNVKPACPPATARNVVLMVAVVHVAREGEEVCNGGQCAVPVDPCGGLSYEDVVMATNSTTATKES